MKLLKNIYRKYILWRLTPAEQLVFRMLENPEEKWEVGGANLSKGKLQVHVGDRDANYRTFYLYFRLGDYDGIRVDPKRFAKKVLYKRAYRLRYRPLQALLFEHLMKAELGEKP